MTEQKKTPGMATRFRGFLPVVVDVETGGFNSETDALLEIAAVLVNLDEDGTLTRGETHRFHVNPFPGANIEQAALEVTGIDPHHPLRLALDEKEALTRIFKEVRREVSASGCTRAVLVGHNANFDLSFLNAAVTRAYRGHVERFDDDGRRHRPHVVRGARASSKQVWWGVRFFRG